MFLFVVLFLLPAAFGKSIELFELPDNIKGNSYSEASEESTYNVSLI